MRCCPARRDFAIQREAHRPQPGRHHVCYLGGGGYPRRGDVAACALGRGGTAPDGDERLPPGACAHREIPRAYDVFFEQWRRADARVPRGVVRRQARSRDAKLSDQLLGYWHMGLQDLGDDEEPLPKGQRAAAASPIAVQSRMVEVVDG